MPAHACMPSRVWLSATPWTVGCQALGKNTGIGCHFLLWGIFSTQGSNLRFLWLVHRQEDSLPPSHLGSPFGVKIPFKYVASHWSLLFLQGRTSQYEVKSTCPRAGALLPYFHGEDAYCDCYNDEALLICDSVVLLQNKYCHNWFYGYIHLFVVT